MLFLKIEEKIFRGRGLPPIIINNVRFIFQSVEQKAEIIGRYFSKIGSCIVQ